MFCFVEFDNDHEHKMYDFLYDAPYEPGFGTKRDMPHLFIASGPWFSETSSMGPSRSETRAVSKDRIDLMELKVYYPDTKAEAPNLFIDQSQA